MYADNLPHQSLRGSFMAKLSRFIHQASAEAPSSAKRSRDSSSESAPSLLGHAGCTPDPAPQPQSSLLPVPHLVFPFQNSIHSFFISQTPVPVGACLWPGVSVPADADPEGFPCRCLSLPCRPLVQHWFQSCRQLLSLLLIVLLLCLGPVCQPPHLICS